MCHFPLAGMVWLFLNYLIGLERLGFEVYYVEWHGRWIANPSEGSADADVPRVLIADVMDRYGFSDRWICRGDHVEPGFTFGGLEAADLPALFAEAEALINVTGAHFLDEDMRRCRRRLYLETDPGLPQIRMERNERNMRELVAAHNYYATWAQNIGKPDCRLPDVGLEYQTTRQPVVLDLWAPPGAGDDGRFTTISRWSKQGKDFDYQGSTFRWSKHQQFLEFIDLPSMTDQPLEIALAGVEPDDRALLEDHGWAVIDAASISTTLDAYQEYIWRSRGEFTIAKDQYVRLRTGWFSDRSACYLAAGRPVVTQDTGFDVALPVGGGLSAYSTVAEAARAIGEVERDYESHRDSARRLASSHFDSGEVLRNLLHDLEMPAPTNSEVLS